MGSAKQDIKHFNARIKRINSPKNKSYYDPDLGMNIPKRVSRAEINKKKIKPQSESLLGPFLVSMIIGGLGVMFAQIVRIRYFELPQQDASVLFVELFVAFWAVLTLSALLRRRTADARFAQILGVGVMMIAGHNIIWRWPDQMAMLYTEAHVEQVMAETTQHSIVLGGNVFGLPTE